MLDAAYDLFSEHGFRATTMDAIASRAGVAVQTLYFTFHTKDDLLQAVQDRAVLGDDVPVPPHEQPWFRAMLEAPRIAASVRHFAIGSDLISQRVAPLIPTQHEVAGDPAGVVWRHSEVLRRDGYRDVVAAWSAKAPLRAGLDHSRAVDLLLVLAGPEVYRKLVVEYGWSRDDYVDWLVATVLEQLFGKRPRAAAARQPA
jgi:AcrR family transcriptional regulator